MAVSNTKEVIRKESCNSHSRKSMFNCSYSLFIAGFISFVGAAQVQAEGKNPRSILVSVRVVEASEALPEGPHSHNCKVSLGEGLEDIRSKLQKLNFKSFKLIDKGSLVVPLLQKARIALIKGQSLTVRPLYAEPGRIGMWLKWIDSEGMEVLDTRMHFDPGESMITGTDSEGSGDVSELSEGHQKDELNPPGLKHGKGLVLAIDVKPSN